MGNWSCLPTLPFMGQRSDIPEDDKDSSRISLRKCSGRKFQPKKVKWRYFIGRGLMKAYDETIKYQKHTLKDYESALNDQDQHIHRLKNDLHHIQRKHDDQISGITTDFETRLKDRDHKIKALRDDLESSSENHDRQTKRLTGEVEGYKEALGQSRARVLYFQPRLQLVTPEEIGDNFDDLCAEVEDWVENRVGQVFSDPNEYAGLLEHIRTESDGAGRLCDVLTRHEDLVNAAKYPETSQDIIAALVWRFLYDEIFSKPFYDLGTDVVSTIEQLADAMAQQDKTKRISDAVLRNWINESYANIMGHSGFADARAASLRRMSAALAECLRVLMPRMTLDGIRKGIEEKIVDGAMRLQEKMKTSDRLYYVRLTRYGPGKGSAMKLVRDHRWTWLGDVFDNMAELDRDARLPPEDDAGLPGRVSSVIAPVCTTAPALMEARLGEKEHRRTVRSWDPYISEDLGEDVCLRKQRHMYAWAEMSEREERLRKAPRGIVDAILGMNTKKGLDQDGPRGVSEGIKTAIR